MVSIRSRSTGRGASELPAGANEAEGETGACETGGGGAGFGCMGPGGAMLAEGTGAASPYCTVETCDIGYVLDSPPAACTVIVEASLFVTLPLNCVPSRSVTVAAGPVAGAGLLVQPETAKSATKTPAAARLRELLCEISFVLMTTPVQAGDHKPPRPQRYTEPA